MFWFILSNNALRDFVYRTFYNITLQLYQGPLWSGSLGSEPFLQYQSCFVDLQNYTAALLLLSNVQTLKTLFPIDHYMCLSYFLGLCKSIRASANLWTMRQMMSSTNFLCSGIDTSCSRSQFTAIGRRPSNVSRM